MSICAGICVCASAKSQEKHHKNYRQIKGRNNQTGYRVKRRKGGKGGGRNIKRKQAAVAAPTGGSRRGATRKKKKFKLCYYFIQHAVGSWWHGISLIFFAANCGYSDVWL